MDLPQQYDCMDANVVEDRVMAVTTSGGHDEQGFDDEHEDDE